MSFLKEGGVWATHSRHFFPASQAVTLGAAVATLWCCTVGKYSIFKHYLKILNFFFLGLVMLFCWSLLIILFYYFNTFNSFKFCLKSYFPLIFKIYFWNFYYLTIPKGDVPPREHRTRVSKKVVTSFLFPARRVVPQQLDPKRTRSILSPAPGKRRENQIRCV